MFTQQIPITSSTQRLEGEGLPKPVVVMSCAMPTLRISHQGGTSQLLPSEKKVGMNVPVAESLSSNRLVLLGKFKGKPYIQWLKHVKTMVSCRFSQQNQSNDSSMLQEMFWASNLWTQHSQLGFVDAGLTNCTLAQRRFLVRHGSSAPV
jgi:hypothetical protein